MSEVSYDSFTRKSSLAGNEETKNDIYLYKRHLRIIRQVSNMLVFILFFFAIFIPWWIMRRESLESIQFLSSERIIIASQNFANETQNLLMKYEIAANLISGYSTDPMIFQCTAENIQNFIYFGASVVEVLQPQPLRFYLSHPQVASCQLEFDPNNSNVFFLSMLFPYNSTHDQVRVYGSDTDFSSNRFDPSVDGIHSTYVTHNLSDFRFPQFNDQGFWSSNISRDSQFNETRILTSYFPSFLYQNDTLVNSSLGGVTLKNSDIVAAYSGLPSPEGSQYILLDQNSRIIIERENGALYPSIINDNVPHFPAIEDSPNPIWRGLQDTISNLTDGVIMNININESMYFIIKRTIRTNTRLSVDFIMLYGLDDVNDQILIPISYMIIILLVVIAVSMFILSFFLNQNRKKKEKRLSRPLISEEVERIINSGTIGEAIYGLRQLEMSTPEEIMMNKVIDFSVINMAKNPRHLFSVAYSSESNCEFCKYLNAEPFKPIHMNAYSNETRSMRKFSQQPSAYLNSRQSSKNNFSQTNPFSTWQNLTFNKIRNEIHAKNSIDIEIDIEKLIVFRFIEFINDKELFFVEIDPDKLMEFAIYFTHKINKNLYKTFYSLNIFCYLFNLDFGEWIENRIDTFVLIFCIFVRDILNIPDNEEINYFDESEIDAFKKSLVINDRFSIIRRKLKILKKLLRKFLMTGDNEGYKYLKNLVFEIFESCDSSNHFEIFGEFKNRIESPEFSVTNDVNDKLLFMKFIFIFTDYSHFFCEPEDFDIVFDEVSQIIFTTDELENEYFIWDYHFEICDKLVAPFVTVLSSLCNVDILNEHLNRNLDLIHQKCSVGLIQTNISNYKSDDDDTDIDYSSDSI